MKDVNLNELAKEIHSVNVEKGFWEKPNDITTQRMLITSELYEAFEAHRKGKFAYKEIDSLFRDVKGYTFVDRFRSFVKDTVEDEIADTFIRLLDYGCWLTVDFSIVPNFNAPDFTGDFIKDLDYLIQLIRMQIDTQIGHDEFCVYSCFVLVQKFAQTHKIDLLTHVRLKLEYNKTRGYKHGKNY